MGFFGKIFKRKKGGTFVGNLIRSVSSKATGGILGNGSGLAKWEAEQEGKEAKAAAIHQQNMNRMRTAQATDTSTTPASSGDTISKIKEFVSKNKALVIGGGVSAFMMFRSMQMAKPKSKRMSFFR